MASHAPMLAPIAADAGAQSAAVFIDLTEAHSPKKEAPDLALERLKMRIFSLRDATTRTNINAGQSADRPRPYLTSVNWM